LPPSNSSVACACSYSFLLLALELLFDGGDGRRIAATAGVAMPSLLLASAGARRAPAPGHPLLPQDAVRRQNPVEEDGVGGEQGQDHEGVDAGGIFS
jgi:hypothetical protein